MVFNATFNNSYFVYVLFFKSHEFEQFTNFSL